MIPNSRGWVYLLVGLVSVWPAVAADLVDAAKDNDRARMVRLVQSGSDVNERGERDATALHWAAFHGNEVAARFLIDNGAGVNVRLAGGSTPLHLAAYKGQTHIARLLLASGAHADAKTRDGVTPLDWAKRNGHQAIVALLAALPADSVQLAGDRTDQSALQTTLTPGPQAAPSAAKPSYRFQLVALTSAERAEEAASRYSVRYADILRGVVLVAEPVRDTERPLYRVQSEPVPSSRAKAICEALRRQDQTCIVRAVGSR